MTYIKDILTEDVKLVSPDTPILDIAKTMKQNDCGAILVGHEDRLIGMITDRDIVLRCVAQSHDPETTHAEECMSPEVLYCYENDDIEDVLENMGDEAIKRLPVLNKDKRLVGIVSFGDLAAHCKDKSAAGQAMNDIREAAA